MESRRSGAEAEGAAPAATVPEPLLPAGQPDEYQSGITAGSLVRARRCWLELLDADAESFPQRFTFAFGSPSRRMAVGLMESLRYTGYAGFVRVGHQHATGDEDAWPVRGTTRAMGCTLASLEHLFMRMRRAGARYDSALVTLDMVPAARPVP